MSEQERCERCSRVVTGVRLLLCDAVRVTFQDGTPPQTLCLLCATLLKIADEQVEQAAKR